METEKLYQKDVYKKECIATILEIEETGESENPVILVLDKTVFFPEGGGQPCDRGKINNAAVTYVYEENGVIYHKIETHQTFQAGQSVSLELDWNRRFKNMQRHCGEHILSGMFFQEYCGVNRGFHMGESYMTIDIDVKDMTWEQAMKVEYLANRAVWSNVTVTTRYFKDRKEAEKLPLRKPLAIDEDITVVCVGSEENPADCVACCGTHPDTSGQVGVIKIIKLESYKGMTRVYFKAGEEAYLDYCLKNDLISKLNTKFSSEEKDLLEKIKIQDEKNSAIRQEFYDLKKIIIERYIEELQIILEDKSSDSNISRGSIPVIVKKFNDLKIDDLQTLGRRLTSDLSSIRLLIFVSPKENTVLLFSNGTPDCGRLVRDNANIYNGKGGGNAANARVIFTKEEYLDTFTDLLIMHLK